MTESLSDKRSFDQSGYPGLDQRRYVGVKNRVKQDYKMVLTVAWISGIRNKVGKAGCGYMT